MKICKLHFVARDESVLTEGVDLSLELGRLQKLCHRLMYFSLPRLAGQALPGMVAKWGRN